MPKFLTLVGRNSRAYTIHARRTLRLACSISNAPISTDDDVREALRTLLQHTAQPVSVLTVKCLSGDEPYHGATLSSFSSVAFHPFPIVSFALQLPSRSADALQPHLAHTSTQTLSDVDNDKPTPNFAINILAASQSDTAIRFSRPDLYPKPFSDFESRYTISRGVPVLRGSLGALPCVLLASFPLREAGDRTKLAAAMKDPASWSGENSRLGPSSSVLYLARVLHVENFGYTGSMHDTDGKEVKESCDGVWPPPLVYHRRSYGTVQRLEQA